MWTEETLKQLWKSVIADLREKFPDYAQLLREKGYRAIVVNRKANYFGQCDCRKRTVCVNLHLHRHSDREQVVDTMLHEIAHALDHSIYGRSSQHGEKWKTICIEIGCNDKATSKSATKVQYTYVMCLHDRDNSILEFVRGYNRKPTRTTIGKYLPHTFLKRDEEGTLGKLIVYPWNTWKRMCDNYGISYFKEDNE